MASILSFLYAVTNRLGGTKWSDDDRTFWRRSTRYCRSSFGLSAIYRHLGSWMGRSASRGDLIMCDTTMNCGFAALFKVKKGIDKAPLVDAFVTAT